MLTRINITPKNTTPLKSGCVLLGMSDRVKGRAVFIAETSNKGTVGFLLNQRKSTFMLPDVLPDLQAGFDLPLYHGGKVAPDSLHMLHNHGFGGTQSGPVNWGGNYEYLKTCIKLGDYDPERLKLLVGYAGWEPGALGDQIRNGEWICVEASASAILSAKDPYNHLLKQTGMYGCLLLNSPAIPELN